MSETTALQEKEATEFAALKADFDANIAAITEAIAALEKGMAGGFLQTAGAQVLRKQDKAWPTSRKFSDSSVVRLECNNCNAAGKGGKGREEREGRDVIE